MIVTLCIDDVESDSSSSSSSVSCELLLLM